MSVFAKIKTTLKLLGSTMTTSALIATNSVAVLAQSAPNPNLHPLLQQAQQELPDDYFVVYAIVDRIARANNLDETPWRVRVTSNYEINAYASDVNLLTFEAGLLDQLEGNPSAIACVVAHEMGHHTKQHLGYGPVKRENARKEEIARLEREQLIAEQDAQIQAVLGAGVATGAAHLGSQMGGVEGQVIGILGSLFGSASQQNARNINQIKAEIEAEANQRYEAKLMEISQSQEFEADELGYLYSVKAGFNPDGCVTVMEVLGRTHGSQKDDGTHPAPEKRVTQIQELMAEYPPETLKSQGKIFLDAKPHPLRYETFSYQLEEGGNFTGLKILPLRGSTEDSLTDILSQ